MGKFALVEAVSVTDEEFVDAADRQQAHAQQREIEREVLETRRRLSLRGPAR